MQAETKTGLTEVAEGKHPAESHVDAIASTLARYREELEQGVKLSSREVKDDA